MNRKNQRKKKIQVQKNITIQNNKNQFSQENCETIEKKLLNQKPKLYKRKNVNLYPRKSDLKFSKEILLSVNIVEEVLPK